MKPPLRVVVVGLLVLLAAGPSFAQPVHTVRCDVPFEFVLQDQVMAPGPYLISWASEDGGVLKMENTATHNAVLVGALNETGRASSDSHLMFNKYGDRYYLSVIALQGAYAKELRASKGERQARTLAEAGHVMVSVRR